MEQETKKEPVKKSAEANNKRGIYIIGSLVLICIVLISLISHASIQRKKALEVGRQIPFNGGVMRGERYGTPMNRNFSNRKHMPIVNSSINGQVTKISGDQITITLPSGESKVITVSNDTTYTKIDPASFLNIQTGQMITVSEQNSNGGSASAQSIRIITAPTAAY